MCVKESTVHLDIVIEPREEVVVGILEEEVRILKDLDTTRMSILRRRRYESASRINAQ